MKSIIVIQARSNSKRLNKKILKTINGIPLIIICSKRLSNTGQKILVATSVNKTDDKLCQVLKKNNINFFRGSLNNTLKRFADALKNYHKDTVVFRATADNIIPDGSLIDELEKFFLKNNLKYLECGGSTSGLPYGLGVEVTYLKYLREAHLIAKKNYDKEHVTPLIRKKYGSIFFDKYRYLNSSYIRATIDTKKDYLFIKNVFNRFDNNFNENWKSIIKFLELSYNQFYPSFIKPQMIIGSAQFGSSYGITNNKIITKISEIKKIMKFSKKNKINQIDTAFSYKKSEKLIGVIKNDLSFNDLKIITKLNSFTKININKLNKKELIRLVKDSINTSSKNLNSKSLFCVLIHRFLHIEVKDGIILKTLLNLKDNNKIKNIGLSVQEPNEIIKILKNKNISYIQMPYNILDHRWNKAIDLIKQEKQKRKINIQVRSIFLQGLILSKNYRLWEKANITNHKKIFSWFKNILKELKRDSLTDLSLAFVKSHDWIDGIIIGIDKLENLQSNYEYFKNNKLNEKDITYINKTRPKVNTKFLNPSNW